MVDKSTYFINGMNKNLIRLIHFADGLTIIFFNMVRSLLNVIGLCLSVKFRCVGNKSAQNRFELK